VGFTTLQSINCRKFADSLRRKRQAGEHLRTDVRSRYRRGTSWRRKARRRDFREERQLWPVMDFATHREGIALLIIALRVIFVLVCLFLILVVLLQSGKGGDVAAAFGGSGSQTAFGPRGAQKPLEKATVVAAILFMLLALIFSLPGVGTHSVVK